MPGPRLLVMFAPSFFCGRAARAQTQASCTFVNFGLTVNIPNLGPGFITPAGINDYGTIVGTATPSNDQATPNSIGFVRWANGGFTFPLGTTDPSGLGDRNDLGISIGQVGGNPVLLKGSTVSDITLNNFNGQLKPPMA
jgi:hypothetical protein